MEELPSGTRKWIGGSSLFAVGVTIYLFQNPERGATIATILSLTLTIVTTALAIRAEQRSGQRATSSYRYSTMSPRAKFWTALVLSVALIVPASTWVWNRWFSDLDVSFPAVVEVSEEKPSTVTPDIASGWRGGELAFTPTLVSVSDLSDCVVSSVLSVEPKLDGRSGSVIAARHEVPVSVNIPEGTRRVELVLQLDAPGNQDCVVEVSFGRSELRR
ncbi:hypothetical protein [Winogradskya humida]|uniref:Uncharacterized protein n=1 Tax=Winogradskya humida TaxID=113566 RepID=A0ABQ4A429_9ACTN|nr:hypothetical protein [Actinoplanes humidus]GIE25601.1 hypothetical protein Ahu01nite_087030 [Actinoplanes humidus]